MKPRFLDETARDCITREDSPARARSPSKRSTRSRGGLGIPGAASPAHFHDDELTLALLSRDGWRIVAQPQFDLSSSSMVGAEILARWTRNDGEEVPPCDFVPALRRLGKKLQLFDFVCDQMQALLLTLIRKGAAVPLSLNASVATLSAPGLLRDIDVKLTRARVPAGLMKIEITEDIEIADMSGLASELAWMRGRGYGISMDDFGVGASTLDRLACLPFSELKIDGSLVRGMRSVAQARANVEAALDAARQRNLSVVAEGIETSSQLRLLRELGCRVGQGYAFSRPLEVADFVKKAASEAQQRSVEAGLPRAKGRSAVQ